MSSLFTELVHQLGKATDPELIADAWDRLRAVFRAELKKRGLWDSPPGYLGIFGWERWETSAGAEPGSVRDDALEELVAEGYSYIFVTRIRSLKAQLKVKPNIDGLVLLNVRHLLHERQKDHDPLGFQIFEIGQAAVRNAIDRGDLHVLAGDPRVRNETLLGFDPAAEPREPLRDLGPIPVRWNDDLMPDLVTARGADQEKVIERLQRRLLELPRHGIHAFHFRSLLDPLKYDARARWATLFETAQAGPGLPPWHARSPESVAASRDSFDRLTRHVAAGIPALEVDPQTRSYLADLWHCLRLQAVDAADDPGAEEPLSQRQIAARLGIPRARLPELFGLLRQLVAEHREPAGCPAEPGVQPGLRLHPERSR